MVKLSTNSPGPNSSPNNYQEAATLSDCQWMLAEKSAGSDATKVPSVVFGRCVYLEVQDT